MIDEMNGINESDAWHDAIAVFTEVSASSTEATRPNIFRIAGFPDVRRSAAMSLPIFSTLPKGMALRI